MASTDELVTRFGGLHPGFALVDYEEVGLPFFELRLDVMAQVRHDLPIIDEYVLRLGDRSAVEGRGRFVPRSGAGCG